MPLTKIERARAQRIAQYRPPDNVQGITLAVRQRNASGLCAVCGQPAIGAGVTCKEPDCVRAWVGIRRRAVVNHEENEDREE